MYCFLFQLIKEKNVYAFITNENLPSENSSSPVGAKNYGICQNIILKFFSSILVIAEKHMVKLCTHMWLHYFPVHRKWHTEKCREKIGIILPIEKFISRVEKET